MKEELGGQRPRPVRGPTQPPELGLERRVGRGTLVPQLPRAIRALRKDPAGRRRERWRPVVVCRPPRLTRPALENRPGLPGPEVARAAPVRLLQVGRGQQGRLQV